MARRLVQTRFATASLLVCAASAFAEDAAASAGQSLAKGILDTVVYGAVGIVVLLAGYKIFDLVTPFSLNKEIAEDNNTAAGVVVAGIMVALGLIVASAIS